MALTPIRRGVPVKGMNTVVPIRTMAEEFAPSIEDAWFEDGIQLKRRPAFGNTHSTSPANAVTVSGMFEHGSDLFNIWVDASNTHIENMPGSAPSTTFISTTAKVRATILKNTSIWGNGVDSPQKFDGSTWSNVTTLPSSPASTVLGNIFTTYKGRAWAAGDPSFPMTVFFSDAMTSVGVDYWDSVASAGKQGGFLDISGDLPVPDAVTGLTSHRGYFVVLCQNHVLFYVITDPIAAGGITLYKIVRGEGCVNHDTIRGVGEDTIFLSPNGFKSLQKSLVQGDSEVNDISMPINNRVKAVLRPMSDADKQEISATYNATYGLYLCTLTGVESWAYQVQFKAWMRWHLPHTPLYTDSSLITWMNGAASIGGTHYYGLFQLDTYKYADVNFDASTTAIDMIWKPSPFRAKEVETKNRWNKTEIIYESGASDSVTVKLFLDEETTPLISSTLSLSPSIDLGVGRYMGIEELPLFGRSELASIQLNNNNNTDFRINLLEMYYNPGGIR